METYPKNIYDSLDFNFVLQEVAQHCTSSRARERTLQLKPLINADEIKGELKVVDEILSIFLSGESFPSTQFQDISGAIGKLRVQGNSLEEKEFSEIRSSLSSYNHLYDHISKKHERYTHLFKAIESIIPQKELVQIIDEKIDERGQVRSNASPELAEIRRRLVRSRTSALRIFDRVLKKYRDRGVLADFDETISENRRVLAIQASYKGQVSGIFHGSSSKNSIVYIEPGETVEINNEIAQLLDDEKQEVRKILRELSNVLRPQVTYLSDVQNNLIYLDFIKAKALFAHKQGCCLPSISQEKNIHLKDAYNPVLRILNTKKGKNTISLNLDLQKENRILVISGPNAGGKSIALKTLGLLNLMLQSGLLVPVDPSSKLAIFSKIYADIGDSQSIENELSTYSSKLQKMQHFLTFADDDTLLLIDEFGSGSDPELGSAMAQVFLEKLNSFGVFGIFTTHYNAIKALAAQLPGVRNAAMLFNKKDLSPEFRLEIGNPGSSYTFEVAQKSGIASHIIEEARKKTSRQTLKVDELIIQLQDDKLQLENKKNQLNKELSKLKKLQAEQTSTIQKLEEKLNKQSRMNEENDRQLYWGQRFEKLVEGWMDQGGKKDKKAVVARFIGILNQRSGEVEKEEKKAISKAQSKRDKQINELKKETVQPGERVKVLSNGMTGTISEIKKDRYVVTFGNNISATLDREQFIPASVAIEQQPKAKKRKKKFVKPQKSQSGEKSKGNTKS